jgi:hypothetical protein
MTGQQDPNPLGPNDPPGGGSQPNGPADHRRAEIDAARDAARRAALDVARGGGAHLTARPAFPGARFGVPDLEPLTGLHASRQVELAARHAARDYVRLAREEGRSWHEIGHALGLEPGGDRDSAGRTVAEAAYTYVAGDPDSDYAWRYGRSFVWTCHSCDRAIGDSGPCLGPANDERGHADTCERLQAAMRDRDAGWDSDWDTGWEAGR